MSSAGKPASTLEAGQASRHTGFQLPEDIQYSIGSLLSRSDQYNLTQIAGFREGALNAYHKDYTEKELVALLRLLCPDMAAIPHANHALCMVGTDLDAL